MVGGPPAVVMELRRAADAADATAAAVGGGRHFVVVHIRVTRRDDLTGRISELNAVIGELRGRLVVLVIARAGGRRIAVHQEGVLLNRTGTTIGW